MPVKWELVRDRAFQNLDITEKEKGIFLFGSRYIGLRAAWSGAAYVQVGGAADDALLWMTDAMNHAVKTVGPTCSVLFLPELAFSFVIIYCRGK